MSTEVGGDPAGATRTRRALAITARPPDTEPDPDARPRSLAPLVWWQRRAGERWVHLYGLGPRWYVAVRDGNGATCGWQWPADLGDSYGYARDVATHVWRHLRAHAVAHPDAWEVPQPERRPDADATGEEAIPA